MHIVMYASGIPFNGNTINERSLGGSESAAYYVAKELAERGHRVCVFTELEEGGEFDGVKYLWVGPKDQQNPLGTNWHFYCTNTPHDVNIIQRMPGGFCFAYQSKINLWWAHDIALKRNNDHIMAQAWQTTRIMPVSNWFKNQIVDNWLVNPDIVDPIHNGVDYDLFDEFELKQNHLQEVADKGITMIYSSRPERGLENLVMPGGIMEQLQEKAPHIQLKVCGYKHPDADEKLGGFYGMLREQLDTLPNCEHIGNLTKNDLYKFMCEEADVWCYPTEFEEVSCITAMECMAAGLSIFTTATAALPETIGDYENCVMFNNTDEGVDIEKFVSRLSNFDNKFRRRTRRNYTWQRTTDELEAIINESLDRANNDVDAVARHYLRNSDIVALERLGFDAPVDDAVRAEVIDLYSAWMYDPKAYGEHYADGTEEMYDGPRFNYESEDFKNHPRFTEIERVIKEKLNDGDWVIDYGSAHGHFTNYLAHSFPAIDFTGIDVSPKAIEVAKAKADELELSNANFYEFDWLDKHASNVHPSNCDLIILGEILEHVPDPVAFMEVVKERVGNVPVVITTPFGPWEEMSYKSDFPKRFHLHHLERGDLEDLFGHQDEFNVNCLPAGHSTFGETIGWYITTFTFSDKDAALPINYERKQHETVPKQTVSFCAIVKNGEYDLPRLLKSVEPIVDEIIIGVDENTTDNTRDVIEHFEAKLIKDHRSPRMQFTVFTIPSPLEIGFDEARNLTIEKATKHWVMWADADEEFVGNDRLPKYLYNNGWNGYGVAQHHFSVEPTAVLSTDYPVRIFRRDNDVKFEGVVHEHPANKKDPNEGVGFAWVNQELHFSHLGYGTEDIRRERFRRNIALMARDREKYPDRILGKFLWIRDLALMNRFELEETGGGITAEMQERAIMGLKLWEETLDKHGDHPQVKRMVKDHLEFYDVLVNCMDRGFTFRFKWSSGPNVNAPQLNEVPELSARFLNKRHLDKFLSVLINDEVTSYEEKYL